MRMLLTCVWLMVLRVGATPARFSTNILHISWDNTTWHFIPSSSCLGIAPRAQLLKKSSGPPHIIGDKAPPVERDRSEVERTLNRFFLKPETAGTVGV